MPVHTSRTQTLIDFGEVQCFIWHADKSIRNPLKLQEKRYVVLSCKIQNGGSRPTCFNLDFHKDASKYEKGTIYHQEPFDSRCFCGFTRGFINDKRDIGSRERYLAFILTKCTTIIRMKGCTEEGVNRLIESCEEIFHEHFGHGLTRSIKIHRYPDVCSKIFRKEVSGRILLSATERRISIISETHHHKCLYSWNNEDVAIEPLSADVRLEVTDSAPDSGSYTFVSSHCQAIKERLMDTMNKYAVIKMRRGSTPDVCNIVRRPSQDSCQSAPPIYPPRPHFPRLKRPCGSQSSDDSNNGATTARLDWDLLETTISVEECCQSASAVEDEYITTSCQRCSQLYSEYMNQLEAEPTTPSPEGSPVFEPVDDYALDLNEFVAGHKDKLNTVINRHDDGGKKYLKTCYSQSCESSDNSSSCSDVSPQSSGNTERSIRVPCKGKYATMTQKLDFSVPSSSGPESQPPDTHMHTLEIFPTLDRVLRHRLPRKTTLQLGHRERCELCMRLYLPSVNSAGTCMEDWQLLGEKIGLCVDAINLISAIVKNHFIPYPAAEVVLRHWQFVYNKYGQTDQDGRCPYPCTKQSLITILREMQRSDLEELVRNGLKTAFF